MKNKVNYRFGVDIMKPRTKLQKKLVNENAAVERVRVVCYGHKKNSRNIQKKDKIYCHFGKKPYLCKPIYIEGQRKPPHSLCG